MTEVETSKGTQRSVVTNWLELYTRPEQNTIINTCKIAYRARDAGDIAGSNCGKGYQRGLKAHSKIRCNDEKMV